MKEILRRLGPEAILAFLTIGAVPWSVWTTKTLFQLQEDVAVIRAVMTQHAATNQDSAPLQSGRSMSSYRPTPTEFASSQLDVQLHSLVR